MRRNHVGSYCPRRTPVSLTQTPAAALRRTIGSKNASCKNHGIHPMLSPPESAHLSLMVFVLGILVFTLSRPAKTVAGAPRRVPASPAITRPSARPRVGPDRSFS
jgi:hypothetical protein